MANLLTRRQVLGAGPALGPALAVPGLQIHVKLVANAADLAAAFATFGRKQIQMVQLMGGPPQDAMRADIANTAPKARMLSFCQPRAYVDAGCLLSYGGKLSDQSELAATYVDKIIRGAKPAELPIKQAKQTELVINLRTARALRLTIASELLLRADSIIE